MEKAIIGHDASGFTLAARQTITFLAASLDLVDGADFIECAFAGEGATLAFDDKRLNYTCGEQGKETYAVLGDLEAAAGGVY